MKQSYGVAASGPKYLFCLTCNAPGGTATLCLTVPAGTRGDAPEDTVKLRLAVPPDRIKSPGYSFLGK